MTTSIRSPLLAVALVAMLAPGTAAWAQSPKPVDPTKKVCRADRATDTTIPRRICHTASEWAQIDGRKRLPTMVDPREPGGGLGTKLED